MDRRVGEIQEYVGRSDKENYVASIGTVYGPTATGTVPFLIFNEAALPSEKSQILKRWAVHFRSVLNCPLTISDTVIDRLLQVEANDDLDLPQSLPETIRFVKKLSSRKALGPDASSRLMDKFTAMSQETRHYDGFYGISTSTSGKGTAKNATMSNSPQPP
nr:unnamed protein product [Spirometra erinaceieuropaei]